MQFNQGDLYCRVLNGKVAQFFYTLEPVSEDYQSFRKHLITEEGSNMSFEHSFGVSTECARPGFTTASGKVVTFKRADDADIIFLLTNWNPQYPLLDWVGKVQMQEGLSTQDKDRIARIVEDFTR